MEGQKCNLLSEKEMISFQAPHPHSAARTYDFIENRSVEGNCAAGAGEKIEFAEFCLHWVEICLLLKTSRGFLMHAYRDHSGSCSCRRAAHGAMQSLDNKVDAVRHGSVL